MQFVDQIKIVLFFRLFQIVPEKPKLYEQSQNYLKIDLAWLTPSHSFALNNCCRWIRSGSCVMVSAEELRLGLRLVTSIFLTSIPTRYKLIFSNLCILEANSKFCYIHSFMSQKINILQNFSLSILYQTFLFKIPIFVDIRQNCPNRAVTTSNLISCDALADFPFH